jgi:hypothetical protein
MSIHPSPHRPAPLALELVAALGMILVLVAGIFVWGRIANDDRTAMLLTALWFALVLVAAVVLTRTNTSLRLPLAAGYILVAAVATVLLGLPMLGDDEVNEQVVTAAPAAKSASATRAAGEDGARERRRDAARARRDDAARAPRANVQVARGAFRSIVHPGTGNAAVIELARGGRKLTLTQFETDNGPDLRVYLATGDPHGGGDLGDFEDLGALKGNKGNQQYDIPKDVNVFRYSTVVVWCRAFSVPFTSARLARS